jgi:hypothetical protein
MSWKMDVNGPKRPKMPENARKWTLNDRKWTKNDRKWTKKWPRMDTNNRYSINTYCTAGDVQ